MATCSNCDREFEKRHDNKGYFRFSLEKPTTSGGVAREELSALTGVPFTPVSNKRQGQFLCPSCWSNLNDTVRYKSSLHELWGNTQANSYIGGKRGSDGIKQSSTVKKPRFTSTPLKAKKAGKSLFQKKATRSSKWDSIIGFVRARQYGRAIKGLYESTKGAKRQFMRFVSGVVRKEIKNVLKPKTTFPLCMKADIPSITDFSWTQTLSDFEKSAPLTYNVLRSAITRKSEEATLCKGKTVNLKPKIGTAVAYLLHAKAPIKASFIPTLVSIQFWRGNLKRDTIKQMSKMGICKGYGATLAAIDNIRREFDSAATSCKREIEEQLTNVNDISNMTVMEEDMDVSNAVAVTVPNIEDEINEPSDSDDTISYEYREPNEDESEESESDITEVEDNDEDSKDDENDDIAEASDNESIHDVSIRSETNPKLQPGFTMCWDNVGKKVTSRHPTLTSTNKYINMALGYMAVNRVTTTNLPWQFDDTVKKAIELPHEIFFPSQTDFKNVKNRMEIIVGRIIGRHLKWFSDNFSDCIIPHVVHGHSAESAHRSVLVNLGVFDVNPSSTQGAITIYENLQRYVPSIAGNPYTTAVFGDGLSCERGNDAHRARANGLNPWDRLEGCEPSAQEFHKEMLLLQDYYDLLFKGSSAADRGTLVHLKNLFNFRTVKSDVSDNFTHAWELMCLATEGFVCLLTMQITEMEDADSEPANIETTLVNDDFEQRNQYFTDVCSTVVQRLWHTLNTNALTVDDGTGPPVFCCGEDLDDDTIACSAGTNCTHGEVFHYMCADIDPNNLPENWHCSDECRNRTNLYAFCHCRQNLGNDEPMIGCAAGSACTNREWYHMKCVHINPENVPKRDWFCHDACKTAKRGKRKRGKKSVDKPEQVSDHIYNYSRSMAWLGLNLLCRRDAVREADGNAMITHWKLDLVHFFASKHPKYLILAHRLLASVHGWLPEKLREDIIHNRTVNYGGGIGRNLPMDFMNEILNRLFKELLSCAKGQYTNATIQRCSQIIGPLGEALDTVFDSQVVENELYRHRRRSGNRDENVKQLISFLQNDKLFAFTVGRNHKAFPDFQFSENPRNPGQFQPKMIQLSKKLDKRRRVILNDD